ncbi:hypothetical protein V1506DRAFT_548342, partial [Lipomyces tetrasporus]
MNPSLFNDAREFREHGNLSREVIRTEGLASDTLVRTTTGVKRVGDVQVGDFLYDAENRPEMCISAAPAATGNLKKITYPEFNSRTPSSFMCTPNYRLSLTATGVKPSRTRNRLYWYTLCHRELAVKDDDPRSSLRSPLSDALNNVSADRFASLRKSLDSIVCDCGGLRRVNRRLETDEQAQLALEVLQSDLHHLIDRLIVRDRQEFSMTVQQYERLCSKQVKHDRLKLYRVPFAFDPTTISTDQRDLPVDPYFLGLWLGDGKSRTTAIVTTDDEIALWLQSYTDRLNSLRQDDEGKLRLTRTLNSAAGTKMRNGYTKNHDVFAYSIVVPNIGRRSKNPVLSGLRELGLLHNKSSGIPSAYMTADEDTRLAVIAGLMESDGHYRKQGNQYKFHQRTDGHRKIVYDLKELALSCGIAVTGVNVEMTEPGFGIEGPPRPTYSIRLGKGIEKFQKYLLLTRKKMDMERAYCCPDARTLTVSDEETGEYRAIEVRGGKFQLANRLVVS